MSLKFNPTNGQFDVVAPGASAGVSSIAKAGDTPLTGAVTLSEGSNVTLTQVGNDIEIAAGGGGGGTPGGSNTQVQYNNASSFGGITGATSNGTTLTLTSGRAATDFSPSTNDGATLGTTALQFSDLYLAEGGVVNWDNGDATITQTSNSVVLAGANLGIATGAADSPLSIANTTSTPVAPQAGTLAHLYSNGANNARVVGDVYSNATNQGFGFQGRKSRGSIGSPSAPNADDTLAFIGGNGYGTTGFPSVSVGALVVRAESGSFSDTSQPTYVSILTSPTGTITPTERLRVASTGYTTIQLGTTINESGADSDTRIEGDTDQNLVFVDASADFVGIGKSNPAAKLDVTGEIRASVAGTNSASVVTVGGTQTLTGKTINGSNNTLTVLAGTQLSGQVPLANGGTGANLTDPGADRILFWDDSNSTVDWLTAGSGLSISGTTITATGLGGDVVGPASATDNAVARFDLTTGKIIQNSVVTIADTTGNVAGVGTINTLALPSSSFVGINDSQTLTSKTLTTPTVGDFTNAQHNHTNAAGGGQLSLTAAVTGTLPVGNGGTGQTTYTDGQLLIGNSSGNTLTKATVTAGTGISVTNGNGSITLASSGGGIAWTEVTGTSQAAAVNNAYITNNAGLVTVTIPTTAAVGSVIRIVGKGAGGWRIAQNASENINFGNLTTTTGTGGRLDSSNRYDCVELVCTVADTTWTVISSQGNVTVT
jgi:hypothetical protein